MKRLFKILKWLLIVVVVLGLVARAALNPVATKIVRAQLAKALAVPASLDGISLSLLSGRAELRGLKIGQPEGFGAGDAVSVGRASADLDVAALRSGTIRVESIQLHDPVIHAVKTKAGMNLEFLTKPSPEKPAEGKPSTPPPAAPPQAPAEKSELPSVLLELVEVRGGAFRYTDLSDPGKGMDLVVTHFTVAVTGLQAGPPLPGAPAEGAVRVNYEIVQKSGTNAVVQLVARVAPVTDPAKPSLALQFRNAGLELSSYDGLPGIDAVGQALGYGFDLSISGVVAQGQVDIQGDLVNEYGQKHPFLRITGPISKPEIGIADVLATAAGLPGKALSAVAGNVADAGAKAAVAVVDTGSAVVSGVGSTVGALADGLFSTGGKILQGDLSGAGEALVDGASATAGAASGTVTNTVGTASSGLTKAAGTAVGSQKMTEWRTTAPVRHQTLFDEAERLLAEGPFPPPVPKP